MHNKYRYLNAAYFTEVIVGRLNGSASQVEDNLRTGFDNITYVKKIGKRATVSAQCQKFNIKMFSKYKGFKLSERIKNDKKIIISADPSKYIDEDVFGFMRADKEELTEEQFNLIAEEQKTTFSKNKNKYTRNITKKRRSNFQMSHLTNVSNGKVALEWNTASTSTDSMPYCVEVTSGIFAGVSNININGIGEYKISDIESEFRDYSPTEPVTKEEIKITKEEKYKRIETVLKGLEYLSIQGNQNNYLTDTSPKFVVLGEHSWGNNVFQGIIKGNGVDIEALKETLEENEEFRLSDIYIGVSKRIYHESYQTLRAQLQNAFENYDNVHVSGVKTAFDAYFNYLKSTMVE